MEFGKIIKTESYFNGKLTKEKTEYSVPIKIQDKPEALTEFIKAIDLIISKKTNKVTLVVEAGHCPGTLNMITKIYIVDK